MGQQITIIGNGALGIGLASKLVELNFSAQFLGRMGPVGLHADVLSSSDFGSCLRIEAPSDEDLAQTSLVFVTVKAYQLESALGQHLPRLPEHIAVIPIGNGCVEEQLRQVAKQYHECFWRIGTTTLAVTVQDKNHCLLNPQGKVMWGPLESFEDTLTPVEKVLLRQGKGTFQWNPNALSLSRKKWLFNTALNTAVGANELRKNKEALVYVELLQTLLGEAYRLGEQLWGKWADSENTLYNELLELIHDTAENENSMARDLRLGRRTESDYLAGLAHRFDGYALLKSCHNKILTMR